jgi:lactate dehydrogenase-like 2-hydroxyacid dehydrogenase
LSAFDINGKSTAASRRSPQPRANRGNSRAAAGSGNTKFTADVHQKRSKEREAQMPDHEPALNAGATMRPATRDSSGSLSNSAPSPEKLVEGRIGFIGLGRMGIEMAANLVQGGCKVIGFVRRPERVKELSALGLEASVEIADLFDCPIVISMLPDDVALREVVFGPDTSPGSTGCPWASSPVPFTSR